MRLWPVGRGEWPYSFSWHSALDVVSQVPSSGIFSTRKIWTRWSVHQDSQRVGACDIQGETERTWCVQPQEEKAKRRNLIAVHKCLIRSYKEGGAKVCLEVHWGSARGSGYNVEHQKFCLDGRILFSFLNDGFSQTLAQVAWGGCGISILGGDHLTWPPIKLIWLDLLRAVHSTSWYLEVASKIFGFGNSTIY